MTLEAIAWRFRPGAPWRDLPVGFGAWQSIWQRHRRWSTDGTYATMFAAVRSAAPADGRRWMELVAVDSTSIRAHQHAAGGRCHDNPVDTGAGSTPTKLPGEPADHALGRSRGGWTTKLHALTDQFCRPLTVLRTRGQAGDNPLATTGRLKCQRRSSSSAFFSANSSSVRMPASWSEASFAICSTTSG